MITDKSSKGLASTSVRVWDKTVGSANVTHAVSPRAEMSSVYSRLCHSVSLLAGGPLPQEAENPL